MTGSTAHASAARPIPVTAQAAGDRVVRDSAAKSLPDTLFEIAYRQPTPVPADFPLRQTMAGYTETQAVAVMVETLAIKPGLLTALEEPDARRCWIALAPNGRRLARFAGLDAAAVNLALASLDAGGFQRIAA